MRLAHSPDITARLTPRWQNEYPVIWMGFLFVPFMRRFPAKTCVIAQTRPPRPGGHE